MKFIESMREGERVAGVYLCKFYQPSLTKNGKPYIHLNLQDKTGVIDAKIWDPNSQGIEDFGALDYVDIMGDVTSFQGMPQLNIKRARRAQEGEYQPGDYLPMSAKDIGEMYQELLRYVSSIQNEWLRQLLESFFVRDKAFAQRFQSQSAAKSVHHGFVGGLLEHTLSGTKLCDYMAGAYPILNRDLLLTAAMFHDIGKTEEPSPFPENDYTDAGQLLGHIMIGAEMVGARIRQMPGFPAKLGNELKHCILAHHGELEYGSPKKPALAEALALNFADNTDAKMETMTEALRAAGENKEWLGYNRLLETNIRRTSM